MKRLAAGCAACATLGLLGAFPAHAQDAPQPAPEVEVEEPARPGGCESFTWDVSHELEVLGTPEKSITAATDGKKPVPIELDQHYSVKLAPQNTVKFAVKPAKAAPDSGAYAGVLSFHAPKAGRYRVSVTTGHWLDLIDHGLIVVSSDLQGPRGCEKVHRIVQFELSGNKDFVLQFSGAADATLDVVVTQVKKS